VQCCLRHARRCGSAGFGNYGGSSGRLAGEQRAMGVRGHDITKVLLTHGHFDHIAGLLVDANGTELALPSAKVRSQLTSKRSVPVYFAARPVTWSALQLSRRLSARPRPRAHGPLHAPACAR
jgi:glyoxylase-like metal-dependent hydrolase (beta-lactamase superfamily II)